MKPRFIKKINNLSRLTIGSFFLFIGIAMMLWACESAQDSPPTGPTIITGEYGEIQVEQSEEEILEPESESEDSIMDALGGEFLNEEDPEGVDLTEQTEADDVENPLGGDIEEYIFDDPLTGDELPYGGPSGSKWSKTNLTWALKRDTVPDYLSNRIANLEELFQECFQAWTDITYLSATKVAESNNPDITFEFKHLIDGPDDNTLAYAYYPEIGDVSIGTHIKWSQNFLHNSPETRRLTEVIVHELGHSLGLTHSASKSDIMYPICSHYPVSIQGLGSGDIAAIRQMYGTKADAGEFHHYYASKNNCNRTGYTPIKPMNATVYLSQPDRWQKIIIDRENDIGSNPGYLDILNVYTYNIIDCGPALTIENREKCATLNPNMHYTLMLNFVNHITILLKYYAYTNYKILSLFYRGDGDYIFIDSMKIKDSTFQVFEDNRYYHFYFSKLFLENYLGDYDCVNFSARFVTYDDNKVVRDRTPWVKLRYPNP